MDESDFIFLQLGQAKKAVTAFSTAVHHTYNKVKYFNNLGIALSQSGYAMQANWFLKRRDINYPGSLHTLFALLLNDHYRNDQAAMAQTLTTLTNHFGIGQLEHFLQSHRHDFSLAPLDVDLLYSLLHPFLKKQINRFSTDNHHPAAP